MTTHLRARTAQAGAFLALVAGLVATNPAAALAAPGVQIGSVSERNPASGSTVTIGYTVSNQGEQDEPEAGLVEILVSANNGASCSNNCSPSKAITASDTFESAIKMPTVAAGQTRQVSITITARTQGSNEPGDTKTANVTVQGPAAPTTVRQVSGRIKDDEGARVSGVRVVMKDSAGKSFNTSTNGEGGYSFTSSDSNPIAAGNITVAAAKDGYESASATVQGAVGRTVNVPLTIKKVATASPSASPSASASASPEATEEETEEEPTDEQTGINDLGQDQNEAANTSEDGGSNWLLIIMGVLLVAAGIGAMVLVWLRRKKAEELAAETGIGKIPPATGGGGFDQTRVAAPVGGGRGNDATMVAPAAGMGSGGMGGGGMGGGGMGDAPTVIHRTPVEDEFPDPYGAPLPSNGGYGGQNDQWGDQQGGNGYGDNYGGGTQPYGQQQGGGGYGAGQGGYDGGTQRYDEGTNMYQPQVPHQQQRYDEHTNMYQPGQDDNYGGGYDQGGYGQQGGYDQGGYGQQGGYDQGGYNNQHQQGGFDQGGWDNGQQQGGYGQQQPPQQQGGWDDDQQGYDQRGGNYGGQNRNWNG